MEQVIRAFEAWSLFEDRPYYRLSWPDGAALYRAHDGSGWYYDAGTDSMTEVGSIAPALSPWTDILGGLLDQIDVATEVA